MQAALRPMSLPCAILLAAAMLAGCTGEPTSTSDRDQDGLYDVEELTGWNVTVMLAGGARDTRHVNSDPRFLDGDGDGLSDLYERTFALDPRIPDTDLDGLTDCQEIRESSKAHCEDPGWVGLTDGGTHTQPGLADTDGDGLTDGQEWNGLNVTMADGTVQHIRSSPTSTDSDQDFLPDKEERRLGTNPTVRDTDSDGCADGLDPLPEVRESYLPGLRSLTFNATGAAQLRLTLRIADATVASPGGEGGFDAQTGPNDLSSFVSPPVRPQQCSFSPDPPLVNIDLIIEQSTVAGWKPLDFNSKIAPPATLLRVWWNLRDGTYSQDQGGTDAILQGPLEWRGVDGTLVMQPVVLRT